MHPSFVVFSGGSACNHILNTFHQISNHNVSYILGISDNGGSTSEILRVLGGPSVGDLRSRLIRLMDTVNENSTSTEMKAIKELLSYRLPVDSHKENLSRDEWAAIVEGRHSLWNNISTEKKEAIRGFLTLFDFEILKRAHKRFNFANGSIGNFFLTGARLFTGSLEAAIFLFASMTNITSAIPKTSVTPVINTNQTATIAAELINGETLVGQCEISHPSPLNTATAKVPTQRQYMQNKITTLATATKMNHHMIDPIMMDAFFNSYLDEYHYPPIVQITADDGKEMFEDTPTANASTTASNLFFSKNACEQQKLTSPIDRIYYINEYGQEIYPVPNPKVIDQLSTKDTLIYSIGSLYTSLIPCLMLRQVGNAIARSATLKHKILLLNGSHDRETDGYTALTFINAIVSALNESQRIDAKWAYYQSIGSTQQSSCEVEDEYSCCGDSTYTSSTTSSGNSTIVHTPPTSNPFLPPLTTNTSSNLVAQPQHHHHQYQKNSAHLTTFPNDSFCPSPPNAFITHLIYLDNSQIPVDVTAIEGLGIQCVCMEGDTSSTSPTKEPVYNEAHLTSAIESILRCS